MKSLTSGWWPSDPSPSNHHLCQCRYRETVHLALTFASLNDLEVKVGNVLNAYITTPVKEEVWTILGPKFGHDSGKSAVIVRALYGLKSTGAAFQAHLASFMRQMGYTSCKADPDLWLKAVTRSNAPTPIRRHHQIAASGRDP